MTSESAVRSPTAARLEWEGIGLGVLSGLLYGLPFAFPSLWFLAWVAFVPVASLYALPRWRRGSGPAPMGPIVLVTFVSLLIGVTVPISKLSPVAGLLFILFYMPFPIAGLLVLRRALDRTHLPVALVLPVTSCAAEYAWSYWSTGALAFELIGYTQYERTLLIQIADVTGVGGVSFLICLVNGALVDALRAATSRVPSAIRTARLSVGVAAAAVAVTLAYGAIRGRTGTVTSGPTIALVQPSVPHGMVDFNVTFARQLDMVMTRIAPGQCDLVALPENALQDYIQDARYAEDFAAAGAATRTPLLIGANGVPPEHRGKAEIPRLPTGLRPAVNEAALVMPDGTIAGEVIKVHLMPWTERIPLVDTLARIHPKLATGINAFTTKVVGFAGSAVPATEPTLLELPTAAGIRRFWVPICFESADARLCRKATSLGAEFFVNITSEGLLGPQIFRNMIAISTFRAVENRMGIARATNTGISCFIEPTGRIGPYLVGDAGRLWDDAGVLVHDVKIDSRRGTLYTRLGDWLQLACLAGVALLLVATRRRG